ncbi:efflux RND transporter periplasmic adaptor subunit [bacterium]|nr:efflux RND transporter periplasmic adaptor subunit [bacterium]
MIKKGILWFSLILLVFCGESQKNIPSEAPAPEHEKETHSHEISLTPTQLKEWGIQTEKVTPQPFTSRIHLSGSLTLNKNNTAHISSYVTGKVISLSADLGEKVKKGQVLTQINSPQFAKAQAEFLQARARLVFSRNQYQRARMLLKEKAIEKKEYLRREAQYQKLSTEYGALQSILHSYGVKQNQIQDLIQKCENLDKEEDLCQLASPRLPLHSPLSGTVVYRDVVLGEQVDPQKTLFTVSDLNTLWALLDAYEKDLPYLQKKSQVFIKSSVYPGKKFPGVITYISETLDEKLRTFKVRVEVQNQECLLKPHMYVQGVVENQNPDKKILAVPEKAIHSLNGEKIVFVREKDHLFTVRHIQPGKKMMDRRVITHGLSQGETIVTKGAFTLKTEITKKATGHTHVH